MMKSNMIAMTLVSSAIISTTIISFCPAKVNAVPYLKVGNYLQIVDRTANQTYNSNIPDVYSYYPTGGPIYNGTGNISLGTASAVAKGNADYGILGFYAYVQQSGNTSANAWGGSRSVDTWTISNANLNGTQGSLSVWVDVDGSVTGTIGHPGVYGGAIWSVGFVDDTYSEIGSWDYSTILYAAIDCVNEFSLLKV